MIKDVRLYDEVEDSLLKFAVITARSGGKWVFCRHRGRTTLEIPGGHREPGESVDQTAARELREETGAKTFTLRPVCVYSVVRDDAAESFGGLYTAEISSFGALHSEIEEIFCWRSRRRGIGRIRRFSPGSWRRSGGEGRFERCCLCAVRLLAIL